MTVVLNNLIWILACTRPWRNSGSFEAHYIRWGGRVDSSHWLCRFLTNQPWRLWVVSCCVLWWLGYFVAITNLTTTHTITTHTPMMNSSNTPTFMDTNTCLMLGQISATDSITLTSILKDSTSTEPSQVSQTSIFHSKSTKRVSHIAVDFVRGQDSWLSCQTTFCAETKTIQQPQITSVQTSD